MIVKEFEGKNEREAIDKAIEALGLDRNQIDFEIVENKKPGILFRGGKVKIRVHLPEDMERGNSALKPQTPFEERIFAFVSGLISRMGIQAQVVINFREEKRLGIDIETDNSGILIGKQGRTLEALQLIVTIASGKMGDENVRVVVDTQDYRSRRERNLIRFAYRVAEQVRKTGGSRLLEAMNPFERRLIHTALNDLEDIKTESEGEGLYKKIRVKYTGNHEAKEE